MPITIETFGFNNGAPPEGAEWVADVRDIDSSVYGDLADEMTGLDEELRTKVLETETAKAWIRKFELDVIPDLEDGDLIAVGCSHGVHRSVSVAIALTASAESAGMEVELTHRDLADWDGEKEPRDTTESMETMSNVTKLSAGRNWYEIKNATGDVAEIFIYDQIGEDFWTGEGITSKAFISDLGTIKASEIHLHVNSPGGSVFDGIAIANALTRHAAKVTTFVDGLAASIASIIALAGERIVMSENALFMIHNPWGGAQGDATDMRKMADVLDKIRDTLVSTYEAKTGISRDEIIAAMEAETWYTAEEALAAGFIDEISKSLKVAALIDVRKLKALGFVHVPEVKAWIATEDEYELILDAYENLNELTSNYPLEGMEDSDKELVTTAIDALAAVISNLTVDPSTEEDPEIDPGEGGAPQAGSSVGATEPRKTGAFVDGLGFIKL